MCYICVSPAVKDNLVKLSDKWSKDCPKVKALLSYIAKDNDGEYIYDETIAEAFHDTYLNKDNAIDASKYIIKVLKKYLENR